MKNINKAFAFITAAVLATACSNNTPGHQTTVNSSGSVIADASTIKSLTAMGLKGKVKTITSTSYATKNENGTYIKGKAHFTMVDSFDNNGNIVLRYEKLQTGGQEIQEKYFYKDGVLDYSEPYSLKSPNGKRVRTFSGNKCISEHYAYSAAHEGGMVKEPFYVETRTYNADGLEESVVSKSRSGSDDYSAYYTYKNGTDTVITTANAGEPESKYLRKKIAVQRDAKGNPVEYLNVFKEGVQITTCSYEYY